MKITTSAVVYCNRTGKPSVTMAIGRKYLGCVTLDVDPPDALTKSQKRALALAIAMELDGKLVWPRPLPSPPPQAGEGGERSDAMKVD